MRLLYVITDLDFGGAENQVVQLARRFQARGWAVMLVSMLPPRAFVAELERAGVQVAHLGMRRGFPDPRAIIRLARLIRRWRPDVVHSHMVHANLLARVTRLIVPVRLLICTAHSILEGGRWRELAYRLTDPLCDLTTHVSQAGAERAVRVGALPAGKVQVVPNGVDTMRFHPDPSARVRLREMLGLGNHFVWLAVGRFETPKDYPTMLRAFACIRRQVESLLLIAGQGSLLESCRLLAKDLHIEDAVHFLGVRQDIPALMNAADAFLMSSQWEGMPMVLLEAAASGLPVVATAVGGNGEVVSPKQKEYLVQPQDADALCAAMLKLMNLSPAERQDLGQGNRLYVEAHYNLEKIVDVWEKLYEEQLLSERRPPKSEYYNEE